MRTISAILLAAGESRRMGSFKQLLPFGGKSFVECCVDSLLAAETGEVIVVTGHREAEVRQALGGRDLRVIHNPAYRLGMSESIKSGVSAVASNAAAVLVALVDQPQIAPEIVNSIIRAYRAEDALIVVPTHDGRGGHPVLLDMALKAEILSMDPEEGLRKVVANHDRVLRLQIKVDLVLKDFDYPQDYLGYLEGR